MSMQACTPARGTTKKAAPRANSAAAANQLPAKGWLAAAAAAAAAAAPAGTGWPAITLSRSTAEGNSTMPAALAAMTSSGRQRAEYSCGR